MATPKVVLQRKKPTELSKYLTVLEQFEAEGQWGALQEALDFEQASNEHGLISIKSQILSSGMTPDLALQFAGIRAEDLSPTGQLRYHLLHAFMLRRQKNLIESTQVLEFAASLAEKHQGHFLHHEFLFQKAVVISEAGNYYGALEIYSDLRKLAPSKFRLGLSALNECGLLWDLGLYQKIESLLHLIPEKFLMRTQLCIDLCYGRWGKVETFLQDLCSAKSQTRKNFDELPAIEKESILIHLSEWILLMELESSAKLLATEFTDVIEKSLILSEVYNNKKQEAALLDTDEVDLTILRFLQAKIRGLQKYRLLIEPILQKRELFGPLLPRFAEIEKQSTPYALLWFNYLQNQKTLENESRLEIVGDSVILYNNNEQKVSVHFGKQPVTLLLLRALQGERGQNFKRESLHLALTGTKFVFHLHDQRIHKLLQRTSRKIEETCGIIPWIQPGNRMIQLNYKISAAKDKGVK